MEVDGIELAAAALGYLVGQDDGPAAGVRAYLGLPAVEPRILGLVAGWVALGLASFSVCCGRNPLYCFLRCRMSDLIFCEYLVNMID